MVNCYDKIIKRLKKHLPALNKMINDARNRNLDYSGLEKLRGIILKKFTVHMEVLKQSEVAVTNLIRVAENSKRNVTPVRNVSPASNVAASIRETKIKVENKTKLPQPTVSVAYEDEDDDVLIVEVPNEVIVIESDDSGDDESPKNTPSSSNDISKESLQIASSNNTTVCKDVQQSEEISSASKESVIVNKDTVWEKANVTPNSSADRLPGNESEANITAERTEVMSPAKECQSEVMAIPQVQLDPSNEPTTPKTFAERTEVISQSQQLTIPQVTFDPSKVGESRDILKELESQLKQLNSGNQFPLSINDTAKDLDLEKLVSPAKSRPANVDKVDITVHEVESTCDDHKETEDSSVVTLPCPLPNFSNNTFGDLINGDSSKTSSQSSIKSDLESVNAFKTADEVVKSTCPSEKENTAASATNSEVAEHVVHSSVEKDCSINEVSTLCLSSSSPKSKDPEYSNVALPCPVTNSEVAEHVAHSSLEKGFIKEVPTLCLPSSSPKSKDPEDSSLTLPCPTTNSEVADHVTYSSVETDCSFKEVCLPSSCRGPMESPKSTFDNHKNPEDSSLALPGPLPYFSNNSFVDSINESSSDTPTQSSIQPDWEDVKATKAADEVMKSTCPSENENKAAPKTNTEVAEHVADSYVEKECSTKEVSILCPSASRHEPIESPQSTFDNHKDPEDASAALPSPLPVVSSNTNIEVADPVAHCSVEKDVSIKEVPTVCPSSSGHEPIESPQSTFDNHKDPEDASVALPSPMPIFSNNTFVDLIDENSSEASTQSSVKSDWEDVNAIKTTDEVVKSTCPNEKENTAVPATNSEVADNVAHSSVEKDCSIKKVPALCPSSSSHVPTESPDMDLTTRANNRLAEIIASLKMNLVSDKEKKEQEAAQEPEDLFVNKIQLTELPSIVQDMLSVNEPTDLEDDEFNLVIDEAKEADFDANLINDIDETAGLDAERNKQVGETASSSTCKIPASMLDVDDSLDREIFQAIANDVSGKTPSELNSAALIDGIDWEDELLCDLESEKTRSILEADNETKIVEGDRFVTENVGLPGPAKSPNTPVLIENTATVRVLDNIPELLSKVNTSPESNTVPSVDKTTAKTPCNLLNVETTHSFAAIQNNTLHASQESLLDELHLRIEESDEETVDTSFSVEGMTNESAKVSSDVSNSIESSTSKMGANSNSPKSANVFETVDNCQAKEINPTTLESSKHEQQPRPDISAEVPSKQTKTTEEVQTVYEQVVSPTSRDCTVESPVVEGGEKELKETNGTIVENLAELTSGLSNLLQDNVTTTADLSSNVADAESVIKATDVQPPISRPSDSGQKSTETLLLSTPSMLAEIKEPQVAEVKQIDLPNETQPSCSKVTELEPMTVLTKTPPRPPNVGEDEPVKVHTEPNPNPFAMSPNALRCPEPKIVPSKKGLNNDLQSTVSADINSILPNTRQITSESKDKSTNQAHRTSLPSTSAKPNTTGQISKKAYAAHRDDREYLDLQKRKYELELELMVLRSKQNNPSRLEKSTNEIPDNLSEISADSDCVSLSFSDLSEVEPGEIFEEPPMPRPQIKKEPTMDFAVQKSLKVTIANRNNPFDLRHQLNAKAQQPPRVTKSEKKNRRKHRKCGHLIDELENVNAELLNADCNMYPPRPDMSIIVKSEQLNAINPAHLNPNYRRSKDPLEKRVVRLNVKEEFPAPYHADLKYNVKYNEEKLPVFDEADQSHSQHGVKREVKHQSSRSPERHPEFNRSLIGPLQSPSSARPFGEKSGRPRSPKFFEGASTSQRELQRPPMCRSRSPRRRSRSPRRSPVHLTKISNRSPDRPSRSTRRSPVHLMKISKRSPNRPSRSPTHQMKISKRSPDRPSRSPRRSPVHLMKISKRSPDRPSRSPRRSPVHLMKISKRSPDGPSRSPRRRSISPKLRRVSRSPERLLRSPKRRSRSASPKKFRRSLSISPRRIRRLSRSPPKSPVRLSPRRRLRSPKRRLSRSPRRSSRSPRRSPRRLSRSPKRSPRRLSRSPRRSPRRLSRSPKRSPRRLSRSPRRSPRRLSRSPKRSPRRLSRSPRRSPRRLSRSPKRSPRRLSRSPRRSPRRLSRSPRRSSRRLSRSPRRSPRRLSRSPRGSPRRLSRSPRRSPRRLSRSPRHSPRRSSQSPRRSPRRSSRSPRGSSRRLSRSPRRSPRRLSRSPKRSPRWSPRSPRRSPSQSSSYVGRALSRSPLRIENFIPKESATSRPLSDRSSESPINFLTVPVDEQILAKNDDPCASSTSKNTTDNETIRSENLQGASHVPEVSSDQPITTIDLSDSDDEVAAPNNIIATTENKDPNECDALTIEVSDDDDEENLIEPPPPPTITAEDIKLLPSNDVSESDDEVVCIDDDEPLPITNSNDTERVNVTEPQFSENSNESNNAQKAAPDSIEALKEKDLPELVDIKVQLENEMGISGDVLSQIIGNAFSKFNASESSSMAAGSETSTAPIPEEQTQPPATVLLPVQSFQTPVVAHVSRNDPRLNRVLQPPKSVHASTAELSLSEPPPPPLMPRLTPAVALPAQSSSTRENRVTSDEYTDDDDYSTGSGSISDGSNKSSKSKEQFVTLPVSQLQQMIDEQIKKFLAANKEQNEASSKKTTSKSKNSPTDSETTKESPKRKPMKNACSKDGSGPRHMTAEKIVSDIKKNMVSFFGTPTPSSSRTPIEASQRKRGRPRKKPVVVSSSESDGENTLAPFPQAEEEGPTEIVEDVTENNQFDTTPSEPSEKPLLRRNRGRPRKTPRIHSSSESDAENISINADTLRGRMTEDVTDIIKLGKAAKSAKVKPLPALKLAEQTDLLTPLKEVPYDDKRKKNTEAHQSKKQKRVPKNVDTSMNCKSGATNCLFCKDKSKDDDLVSHYVNDHRENEVFTARLDESQVKALKAGPNFMQPSKKSSNIEKYTGKCPICDEEMTCTIGRFMEHLASHTGEFAYECDCCGIRDSRKRDLLKHCNKECEKGAKFVYVYRYDLSNKVIEAFVCGICNYIQLNRANVIKHLRNEHETQLLSSEDFVTVTLFKVGDATLIESATDPEPDNIEVCDEAFAYDEDENDFENAPASPMSDATRQDNNDVVECVKNELLQDVIDDFDWKAIVDTLEEPPIEDLYETGMFEPSKPEVAADGVQDKKDETATTDLGTQIFTEIHTMSLKGPNIETENSEKLNVTKPAGTDNDTMPNTAKSASDPQSSKKQKKSNRMKDIPNLLRVENLGMQEVSSDLLKFYCLVKNCDVEPFESLDELRKHLKRHRNNWSGYCSACKKQTFPRSKQLDKEFSHFIDKHLPKKSFTSQLLCPWIVKDTRQSHKTKDVCEMLLTKFALENLYKCMGPDCIYTINSAKDMDLHLVLNHSDDTTALNCSYCRQSFPHSNGLVDHISKVHGSSTYQCSRCFYRSCSAYNVQMHQRTFHKDQKDAAILVCTGHSHTFTTDILEILDYRLKNVQPIKCPLFSACRKNIYAKYLLLDHIRRDHSQKEAVDIESNTYDCIYCSYGTEDLLSIRQHMANEHPDRLLYVCGRVFMKSLHSTIGQDDFDITSIKKTTCLVYIGSSVSKKRLQLTEEVTYASDSIQAVNMGEDSGALNARIRKWFGEAATHFEEVETYMQRIAAGASPDTMNNDNELELTQLVMAVIKNTGYVGKKLYSCGFPKCTQSCENFDQFDRHINGHKGDKKEPIYRCPHCNVIVATNKIRLHTLNHRRHRYLCYFCGESSESQSMAIDHLKSEHQSQGIVFVYITTDKESNPSGTEMEGRIFVAKPRKVSNDDDVADVMRDVLMKRLDTSGNSQGPKDVSKQERPESPVDRKQETTIPVFVSLDTRLTCNMDDCPFIAKTEADLLKHISERHRIMQKGKYECPHCSYIMPPTLRLNINRIWNHLQYHGRTIVVCNVCNYYHHNRLRVLEHMNMCHPFNFASCTVHTRSSGGTKTKLEIFYNRNVRSPDDSYKCTLCDATLTECDDFFIHMKELHLLNVRFVCDTCNFFDNSLQAVETHAKQKHPEGDKVRVRSVFLPAGGKWIQNLSPFALLVESGGPVSGPPETNPNASTSLPECGSTSKIIPDHVISPRSSPSTHCDQTSTNKRKLEGTDVLTSKKDSKRSRTSGGSKRPADTKQPDAKTKKPRLSPVKDHEKSDTSSSQSTKNDEQLKSSDKSAKINVTNVNAQSPVQSPDRLEPATEAQVEEKPKTFLKLVPVARLMRSDIQSGSQSNQVAPVQPQQWHQQATQQPSTSDDQRVAAQSPHELVDYTRLDVYLTCFYCSSRSDDFTSLHSHCGEKHVGDSGHFTIYRRLLCAYCPMRLPYNDMKIHHMQYHSNRAFGTRTSALHHICGECTTVFKNNLEIEDHFKAAHPYLYLQKTPSSAYLTQTFLDDLLKIGHGSVVDVNKCPCCDRIYLQHELCKTHIEQTHLETLEKTPIRTPYNKLLYGCLQCRVFFETETRAIHHTRKHINPYGCKHCEMSFETHTLLVDHYRLFHKVVDTTYRLQKNAEAEEKFMEMLVRFPNGLILTKRQLQNTDYGQREQFMQMIEAREKAELQDWINRQERTQQIESIARIKIEIEQEASLFQPPSGGNGDGSQPS